MEGHNRRTRKDGHVVGFNREEGRSTIKVPEEEGCPGKSITGEAHERGEDMWFTLEGGVGDVGNL